MNTPAAVVWPLPRRLRIVVRALASGVITVEPRVAAVALIGATSCAITGLSTGASTASETGMPSTVTLMPLMAFVTAVTALVSAVVSAGSSCVVRALTM
ncbi:hypothetical protein [Microbacterium sp. CJ88]|uniref:hypothetical protein n=1 Tax=Microbacterium sp. CJ88 TaxID=3445672 RepID=UPI003F65A9BE